MSDLFSNWPNSPKPNIPSGRAGDHSALHAPARPDAKFEINNIYGDFG